MCAFSSILAAIVAVLSADAPTDAQLHGAVERSIPYIQEQGTQWIEEKKCVSCHRVNTMVWSLNSAQRNGFEVSEKLSEWRKWATDFPLSKNAQGEVAGLANKEGVAQIVLGLEGDADSNEVRKDLAALLLNDQRADGSWKAGGQLPSQKRPQAETDCVTTMWLTLALLSEGASDKTTAAIERAMDYIEQCTPGESTEWYVVRLLLAVERKDHSLRDELVKDLRQQQHPDGGWGWIVGEKSDALGTGMAIYALARAGLSGDAPAIQRAQQFLVSTQREDGSWAVHGTKSKKKDHVQETAVYWGTTWAALGLMASLSEQ